MFYGRLLVSLLFTVLLFAVQLLAVLLFTVLLFGVLIFISFECFDDFGYERVADDVFFGEVYEGYAFNAFENVHSFDKA